MHSTHYFSKLELTAINVSFCLGFLLLHCLETGLSVLHEMTEIWPQVSVQLMTQYRKDEEVPEKQSPAFHTHNKKNGHTTLNLYLATGLYWAFSQVSAGAAALKLTSHQREQYAARARIQLLHQHFTRGVHKCENHHSTME